jgi:hypothetical protein
MNHKKLVKIWQEALRLQQQAQAQSLMLEAVFLLPLN